MTIRLESGSTILLEDGDFLLLEGEIPTPPGPQTMGGGISFGERRRSPAMDFDSPQRIASLRVAELAAKRIRDAREEEELAALLLMLDDLDEG
jgi:hypothetical protein